MAEEKLKAPVDGGVSTRTEMKAWKFAFAIVMLATLANQFASNGWTPLQPAIRDMLDMSFGQLGFFTGITGIMGVIAGIPVGLFAKRFGTKVAALMGLSCVAVGLTILGFCDSFVTACSGRMIWMFGFQTLKIVLPAAILILAPRKVSSFVMSFNFVIISLATFIGSPFAAGIEQSMGWQAGFFGFAIVIVVVGLFFLFTYKEPDKTDEVVEVKEEEVSTINPYKSPLAWGVAIMIALVAGGLLTPLYYYSAVMLSEAFGYDSMQIAHVNMIYSVLTVVVLLVSGWISTKLQRKKIIILIELAICLVAVFFLLTGTENGFVIGMVMLMGIGTAASALLHAVPGDLFSKKELPKVFGMIQLIAAGFGGYVLPQIMGFLIDATGGFTICWYLVAAFAVISGVLLAVLGKKIR